MRTVPISISMLLLLGQHAWADTRKAAVIAADTSGINQKFATEVQEGILAQVVDGFAAAKFTVTPISDAKLTAQVRGCAGAPCLQEIAKSEHLDLVVQIRVQVKKAGKKGKPDYDISMIVARVLPDVDSWREKIDCPGCAASEVDHMVSLLATTVGERMAKEQPPEAPQAVSPPLATVPQPVPPPAAIMNPPSPKPDQETWSVPRYVSGSVLAGGLVLAGVGGYLLHINGRGTCDLAAPKEHCPDRYSTMGLGYGLVAGGSLIALGGALGLALYGPRPNSGLAISFDGSSISISGAY